MPDLKPCPFCGHIPTVFMADESGKWCSVQCCIRGSEVRINRRRHLVESRDKAIAAWNLRVTGWRDIATAPKDGTEVLLWGPGDATVRGGYWDKFESCWMHDYEYEARPTHWMPMPDPPKESGANG